MPTAPHALGLLAPLLLFGTLAVNRALVAAELPLGHPDFLPTPTRPVGWRGERTGAWPGATPVTEWDSTTGRNIVWKAPLPGPSWSMPVVVGDRVFITCDPFELLCLSVHDGSILWHETVYPFDQMTPAVARQAKDDLAFFAELTKIYYRWYSELEVLLQDLRKAGLDDAGYKTLTAGGHKADMSELSDDLSAGLLAVFKDSDLRRRWQELYALQTEHGFRIKSSDNGEIINVKDRKAPHAERWGRLVQDCDTWLFNHWSYLCSDAMATPISDGEFIYACMPNDTTVCFTLDGKLRWMHWDHPKDKVNVLDYMSVRFVPSPLLADGVLATFANGEMKAFDAATGRKLWGHVAPYEPNRRAKNEHYGWEKSGIAPSPGHFRLPLPDGEILHVVTDQGRGEQGSNLYRLHDGTIVGHLRPWQEANGALCFDDLHCVSEGKNQGVNRLIAVSRDEVRVERLWSADKLKGSGAHDIHVSGRLYGNFCHDARTGELLPEQAYVRSSKWTCPALGGRYLFAGDAYDGDVVDVANGSKVGHGRLVDDRYEVDPAFKEQWYYIYMKKTEGFSSPVFAANRMFYHTTGYLWCIGDPKQRYTGKPVNLP